MKTTSRFNLKKPDPDDFVNIDDLNHNMDVIDENLRKTPTYVEYILNYSNWSGTTYSLEFKYPSNEYDVEVFLSQKATVAQIRQYGMAMIVGDFSQNILHCKGNLPSGDIPVILKVVVKK